VSQAGRGADAIRALSDLCFGIVSGRLEFALEMFRHLKPRHARGFLCLSVYRRPPNRRQATALVSWPSRARQDRVVTSPGPSRTSHSMDRGASAIRALPDLCLRGNNGNVVYETRAEAEAAAAKLAAANKNPNISFTVTEFEPTD